MKGSSSILKIFISLIIFSIAITIFFNLCGNRTEIINEKSIQLTLDDEINFPYVKETVLMRPMEKFDKDYIYGIHTEPKDNIPSEYQEIFDVVVKKVSKKMKMSLSTFLHGNYRLLKNGLEFNLFFTGGKRISAFQPLSDSLLVKNIDFAPDKKVNIVLPLKGKLSSLETFLDNLVRNIFPVDRRVSLTVVYFTDESSATAEALIKDKLCDSTCFEYNFVVVRERFSRGKGISVGIEAVGKADSDLVFVCDVDVLFTSDFLNRCRANAIIDHQVYFPVVFSLYNPKVVYPLYEESVPDVFDQLEVRKDNGFWRYFGFGMFCMHKKEYQKNGGIPEFTSWGGEDILFYENFVKLPSIKVIRSLDSSIFHIFHHKNCSNVTNKLYVSCLGSKAANEGTNVQLALLHYNQHEGIDVEGILSKRDRSCQIWLLQNIAESGKDLSQHQDLTDVLRRFYMFYYFQWIPILTIVLGMSILGILYQQLVIQKIKKELQTL